MNSLTDVWGSVLQQMSQQLAPTTINTWFDEVDVVTMEDSAFVLHCGNEFKKKTIETRFLSYIRDALRDLFSADFEIKILNDDQLSAYHGIKPDYPGDLEDSGTFTFETYVVGPSNKLAYAAAHAVSDRPGVNYNPLFIYGDSGLGKTHLLYAIAHGLKQNYPDAKVVYIKGDDFTNELVASIREGKNAEFREKYRQATLLLVDDVQFIAGRKQTQEEFFHTFNTLWENHHQIVLTADRPPKEMLKLEDRLKTRFEWGLLADITPPDYETRLAIITNKCDSIGLKMPPEVCAYIAENITTNIRQIEGTVKRLKAYHDLSMLVMDVPHVARCIKDMHKGETEAIPTPAIIISEVCRFYSIEEQVLRGTLKNKATVEARQIAMYLIRKMTNLSLPEIGREFGRDHATVIHSLKKIDAALLDRRSPVNDTLRDITASINNRL